jgi:hypothetical protein
VSTVIAPAAVCREQQHPIRWAPLPTGDQVQACSLCTAAHQAALDEFDGDEQLAEEFVSWLRVNADTEETA